MKFYSWLVVWSVVVTVPTGCPDYKPDPYTGEYPSTRCAVYHCEQKTNHMEKWFATKEEAEKFIENAPDDIKKNMELREN